MRVSIDTFDAAEIRTAVAAGAELVLSVNGSNLDVAQGPEGQRRARRGRARAGRLARHAGADARGAGPLGRARHHRPHPRADRPRLHGVAGALRRDAPPLSRRRDADGRRQPDRADVGRHHRRQRDPDRRVPGAGHPQRADDGGDPVGARRGARDRRRAAADALRGDGQHDPQGRGRSAGDGEGPGAALLHRVGAAGAAVRDHRPQLPHLRRPRRHHRVQQRACSCAAPTSRRSSRS